MLNFSNMLWCFYVFLGDLRNFYLSVASSCVCAQILSTPTRLVFKQYPKSLLPRRRFTGASHHSRHSSTQLPFSHLLSRKCIVLFVAKMAILHGWVLEVRKRNIQYNIAIFFKLRFLQRFSFNIWTKFMLLSNTKESEVLQKNATY